MAPITRRPNPVRGSPTGSTAQAVAPARATPRPDSTPGSLSELSASDEIGMAEDIARVATTVGQNGDPRLSGVATHQRNQMLLALQRTVGNAAVQRLLAGPHPQATAVIPLPLLKGHSVVQRGPGGKGEERRQVSAAVAVKWTEESEEFWRRLAAAAERRLRLHHGALVTQLLALGPTFHTRYQIKHHPPVGRLVRFQVSLEYSPSNFHLEVSNVQVTEPLGPDANAAPSKAAPTPAPVPADLGPQPNEKPAQWLGRQARYVVRYGSEYVAQADKDGYDGAKLTVMYTTGPAVYIAAIERVGGKPKPRPAGTAPKGASTIATELKPDIEMLLSGQPRQIHITFGRDERGIMQDRGFRAEALPPKPQAPVPYAPNTKSQRERLKDLGILDPKQHWKDSFEKTEEAVKDIAIQAMTFGLTEIATMLIGGGLLKLLGAGLKRLPHLYRLIRGKKTKDLAEGLAKLSKTEADEFARLVERANRGEKLSPDDVKRLEALAAKLDDALAPSAKTGQQAASTGSGSTSTKAPTSTVDDAAKSPVAAPVAGLQKVNINYNKQLSTAGWKSSLQGQGYGVFEGRIPGLKDPVAVKVYPKGHAKFADDMAGAEVAARTGYGPKFYGQVDEPGKQAFAMEKLPGSQIDPGSGGAAAIKEAREAASHVTKQTVNDLDAYARKMLEQGYYHTGDIQGLVDNAGRWKAIDFQTVRKLPPTKDLQARQEAIRSHWSDVKMERKLLEEALRANTRKP